MRDYSKLINAGNKAQLEKLKENEHKSGFENLDLDYSIGRLCEEVLELNDAAEVDAIKEKDLIEIRREAADVANFAHMIILKCDQELA